MNQLEAQKVPVRVGIEGVEIFGADLLHPKMLEVIEYALKKEKAHNLQAIFVSATGPDHRLGEYCRHTRSFVISLKKVLAEGIDTCSGEKASGLSLIAACWINMVYVIWHELHHNVALAMDWDATVADEDTEEELAHEFAGEMLEPTIMELKADVPAVGDLPWLGDMILGYLVEELKDGDHEWVKMQKGYLDGGIVFESKEDIYDSMVDYFLASSDHPEQWGREAAAAEIQMVQEQVPNLFDKKILPGQQGELFKGQGTVQADNTVIAQGVQGGGENTAEVNDVHDYLPEEATATAEDARGQGVAEHSSMDPFAPNFTPDAGMAQPDAGMTQVGIVYNQTMQPQPPDTVAADVVVLRGLYVKLAGNIFAACGFVAGGFNNPSGIFTPVTLTEAEKIMVIGSKTLLKEGYGIADAKQHGAVAGCLYKNGTLPAYELLINWNGAARKMRLIAQNAQKQSEPAARARGGAQICWVIDVDGQNPFVAKIEGGQYEVC